MSSENGRTFLLERAYDALDLVSGALLDAAELPSEGLDQQNWRDRGDWLMLASRINVEKLFFVNDDPVLVFSALPTDSDFDDVIECYRRAWSLARPRCLFLEFAGELRVYSLAKPPVARGSTEASLPPLQVVDRAADVLDRLDGYRRERLELGLAFETPDMEDQSGRADQQLLRDVESATGQLVDSGLNVRISQALIERAILVRYLEDREILTDDYFDSILGGAETSWTAQQPPNFGQPSRFVDFLHDRELTYQLFRSLARDFNGDLFVVSEEERLAVTSDHLRLLMNLLLGRGSTEQAPLFLWAYDFSVIPTNLISSMYELFCNQDESQKLSSTHYTPPELVEFVLADVLNERELARQPKVCDPACGSGIFLVEAYRRIVRHEMLNAKGRLPADRLRRLLIDRIAGCDIDATAVRLAAFSLYVAFLNYQSPPDIRRAGPLPPLIHDGTKSSVAPLVVGNAFSPLNDEIPTDLVGTRGNVVALPWRRHSFGIVVGNPPWTKPRRKERGLEDRWASRFNRKVGDRSRSQLFLWRVLDLLTDDGIAALLVSAKIAFNTRPTSLGFRQQWLKEVRLEHVVNFSQVRREFFRAAIAPFMLLRFRREDQGTPNMTVYETARPVPLGRRGSTALVRLDRQVVPQRSLSTRDYLWKTYSAGSIHDASFLARLEAESRLRDVVSGQPRGYGFQGPRATGNRITPESMSELKSLRTFDSWGPLQETWFEEIPSRISRGKDERVYHGQRLIVRRGISTGFGPHARLEIVPFAFRHHIYGISLGNLTLQQAQMILGTLLSSFGRYWLYMVSGSWGTWMDEVRSEDLLDLPVRVVDVSGPAAERLGTFVGTLSNIEPPRKVKRGSPIELPKIMEDIDEAVAAVFRLSDAERYLISDFWAAQKPGAEEHVRRTVPISGTEADLASPDTEGIETYLKVFLGIWNPKLGGRGEFRWRIWREPQTGVIAAVFETQEYDNPDSAGLGDESESWLTALRRIGLQLAAPQTNSILRYGMARVVTDTAIVIIKRDEQHMWTARSAWQDADATIAQAMSLELR